MAGGRMEGQEMSATVEQVAHLTGAWRALGKVREPGRVKWARRPWETERQAAQRRAELLQAAGFSAACSLREWDDLPRTVRERLVA